MPCYWGSVYRPTSRIDLEMCPNQSQLVVAGARPRHLPPNQSHNFPTSRKSCFYFVSSICSSIFIFDLCLAFFFLSQPPPKNHTTNILSGPLQPKPQKTCPKGFRGKISNARPNRKAIYFFGPRWHHNFLIQGVVGITFESNFTLF